MRADLFAHSPRSISSHGKQRISFCLIVLAMTAILCPHLPADSPVSGGSGKPPSGAWLGDPVYVNSGSFGYSLPLLRLGGPLPLEYALSYRTDGSWMGLGVPMDPNSSAHFQHGVFPNVESWVPDASGVIRVYFETMRPGELLCFLGKQTVGNWSWVQQEASPVRYVLTTTASGSYWLMDPIGEKIYLFEPYNVDNGYRILAYMDRNGNRWTYSYASSNTILPTRVEDGLGRSLQFTFASTPAFELRRALTRVTDQSERTISFESTPLAYYTSVTDAVGKKTSFSFDSAKYLTQITRPRGNAPYRQAYANANLNGKVERRTVTQTDTNGRVTSFNYDSTSNKVTVTHPDNTTEIYRSHDNNGTLQSITDAAGRTTIFTQTSLGQPNGVIDRLGNTTASTYHTESGKILSVSNAKGKTTSFTYSAQNQTFSHPKVAGEAVTFTFYNLTRINYPDGTSDQFSYDTKGNCSSRQDAAGAVTSFTYDSRGQLLTVQNPAGGTLSYTYNVDGTLASHRDSDTGIITSSYDAYKRLSQTKYPDGTSVRYTYDLSDRIAAVTDGRGYTTSYSYDDNGNLTRIADAAGKTIQYDFDQMDRILSMANRLGETTKFTYDIMGRLASVSDSTGIPTTFAYDSRGWLIRATRAQQTHRWEYDNEGSVLSTTSPSDSVLRREVDALGQSARLTSATGGTTTLARSEMDRVTSVNDPLNRITAYGYNSRGLLTNVTLPDNSAARYERDPSGWFTRITDPNSKAWTFTRSLMGRLQKTTDPLNQVRQYGYDSQGRMNLVTYPGGNTLTMTRDTAGNVTRLLYSNGPDLSFTYDSLNRVTNAGELQIIYDNEGRVATTIDSGMSFGVTRDDAGRILSASYANGALAVNYAYDAATGLLTSVRDTLTQAQVQFSYDADRRLIGIGRGNGVNSTMTYDAASRLTTIRDTGPGSTPILDCQATMDAAGQVISTRMTAPLDPAPLLSQQINRFSHDAASQINNTGYRYDPRGRMTSDGSRTYTWDEASRLTGTGEANLTYSNFGDLRTRTAGAKTIRYYVNNALALNPILAEQDAVSLQFLKYYVWTPGGKLLYMIDAANGNRVYFYHPDRVGSILALTDSSGNVTDSYAYTPGGKLLRHQGGIIQPFTYLGYFGVRQEGESGTLYQMRTRYYDAVAGRFLTREPQWPNLADPRQLNPYAYALNNPLSFGDLTGLAPAATDAYRWEISWYEGGMMHSTYGVTSGGANWLLPGIGMISPPPPPKPSGLQARWIASCGGNTQAFNKMLGLIQNQQGPGSGGYSQPDTTLGAAWNDPYGSGYWDSLVGAQHSTGTTGIPDHGSSTFGSVSYINQANNYSWIDSHFTLSGGYFAPSLSFAYDYGPSTYGTSIAGTTLFPNQSLSEISNYFNPSFSVGSYTFGNTAPLYPFYGLEYVYYGIVEYY